MSIVFGGISILIVEGMVTCQPFLFFLVEDKYMIDFLVCVNLVDMCQYNNKNIAPKAFGAFWL